MENNRKDRVLDYKKMIITIKGLGKTTESKRICEGKKSFTTDGKRIFETTWWANGLNKDIEYIICENVPAIYYEKVFDFFNSDELTINKQGKNTEFISMPNIIICLDDKF